MKDILVILGTAHLSSTPGKRSPDGQFREYKYSREICKDICRELQNKGIKSVIDYPAEDMEGLNSSQELVNRVKVVNDYCNTLGADTVMYVSVHTNAAADYGWSKATGWSIYTSPGTTKSDVIADHIYNAAKEILTPLGKKIRTDFKDGDADYEENFYVLRKTLCPAVLTENFFQDNKSDIEWLESREGRKAITDIHVKGIENYIKSL